MRSLKLLLLSVVLGFLVSCSDDDEGTEYLFDREVMELSVLRSCADKDDSSSCYRIRFHYPIQREDLDYIRLWLDTNVVDDTSKSVSSKQIDKATASFKFSEKSEALYDTIDLTEMVEEYLETYDSLQVALFCDYSDGDDPGAVQRVFLHFGDDIAPSRASIDDSTWTTGARFEWFRPTDQTDFYKPSELSGPIVGYNLEIYSSNKNEDLRKLKVKLVTADGTDSVGTRYVRHARIYSNNDSVWVDSVNHSDKTMNYLRLAILDGKGFDFNDAEQNRFRVYIDGLKSETAYTVGLTSWDSCGNSSGNEGDATVEQNKEFLTTDSIAPLIPKKIFFIEDSLFPGYARLDENNRLRIFWSRAVDPLKNDHGIEVDSVLIFPSNCWEEDCFDTVASYVIDRFDMNTMSWESYTYAGGSGRYSKLYKQKGDTMAVSSTGTFVTDTIRWVAPGDTLILRIRAVDKSRYYSVALIDTVYVSPGALAKEVECPAGFLPVSSGDSSVFCMEKFEHMNDSGEFVRNVLHSEAEEICESISASGFKVSLCNERDWELVCLSGGTLSYGVVEDYGVEATDYLFRYCNVATNDSSMASDFAKRDSRCVSPMGIRDLPGQYQEWVMGRSKDSSALVKGGSFMKYDGIDRESAAYCTNRSFPYFTRLAYTTDPVYLYREGSKVDTVFEADTSRTLYKKLSKKDFKDSLQFFVVEDSSGNKLGEDYALYSEYKKGGDEWLKTLANGLVYKPDKIKVVFLTGERIAYRTASAFYRSSTIGFRCCAYPEK